MKFTISSGKCYKIYITLFAMAVLFITNIHGQKKYQWQDILLEDIPKPILHHAEQTVNPKYPPGNALDGDLTTCWVTHTDVTGKGPALYLRLPGRDLPILNIFAGYGKNLFLFQKNARPRQLSLSMLAAIHPDGYVTESGLLFKTVKFPDSLIVRLADTFAIQHIPLPFNTDKLSAFKKNVFAEFGQRINAPMADSCFILQITVLNSTPGTRYNDICISEIYFNERFITPNPQKMIQIADVFVDESENALTVKSKDGKNKTIYKDPDAVLQLMEVTHNKKWAIVVSMPAEVEGRAETQYLLFDLFNQILVNPKLEKSLGMDISAYSLYFDEKQEGHIFLCFQTFATGEQRIHLK